MIPREIQRVFPADVRARGDNYFASGRVRVAEATSTWVGALVEGTSDYVIELDAERGRLNASCSCPYAADNGICKHIWATLRQVDATGTLALLLRTAGNRYAFDAEFSDDLDDAEEDDHELDAWSDGEFRKSFPSWNPPAPQRAKAERQVRLPQWKTVLNTARREMEVDAPSETIDKEWPEDCRIIYVVNLPDSHYATGLVVDLATERRARGGEWREPKQFRIPFAQWQKVPDARDREIALLLLGAPPPNPYGAPRTSGFVLQGTAFEHTLRLMCETGRCRVRTSIGAPLSEPMRWDEGPPWAFEIRVTARAEGDYAITAVLQRAGEEMPIDEPALLHSSGVLAARGAFGRFEHNGTFALVRQFRTATELHAGADELTEVLESFHSLPRRPPLELPDGAQVTEVREPPQPGVAIRSTDSPWLGTRHHLTPFFLYGSVRVDGGGSTASVFDGVTRTIYHRDHEREAASIGRLMQLGAREEWDYGAREKVLGISRKNFETLMPELVSSGWRVEHDGAVIRSAGQTRASVSSGIDWFDLDAGVTFGEVEVPLSDLLAARANGETSIVLADGSRGLLPLDWLARLAPLTGTGKVVNGKLRYARMQAPLLDALLYTVPAVDVDTTFARAREQLRSFDRIAPADPPRTFRGVLRAYQRDGLGWLHFLRDFGLGGCLADDMGLGKTVQVLALLDARRGTPARPRKPSIVVVPRSLVFNWLQEAERFAPRLRVLDHSGAGRSVAKIRAGEVDLVLTTYGTLRRDASDLASIEFDYAILDEAQAIKTAGSVSAKAARLLRADHRLAMTGTPIENRLEELWSLFEFLNPGLLGGSSSFASVARLARTNGNAASGHEMLARAIRPVILRRTKGQVATDLPERTEQTLAVELEGAQRKFYDQLLEAYRRSVFERVERVGLAKAKMHILEALLRLRQAACHPVLADPRRTTAPSAKLDALLPALTEVVAEGHKVLVFSQFTSFLAIARERLDAAGVPYEYLDGRTRDRQARVRRFQEDEACPVFLISLKAGGHGLNLTAADYVFILDPWWNPAVEAQAIDRAHRIGQSRHVIATRIVARATVEEKILELQASKRALADAILGEDRGGLAAISREELTVLLG